jgi:hypothetical protein
VGFKPHIVKEADGAASIRFGVAAVIEPLRRLPANIWSR